MLSDEAQMDGRPFGAIGVREANRQANATLIAEHVLKGSTYVDTLLCTSGSPLYVGYFSNSLPQGPGRLFWAGTGYEAFIGEFEYGLPSRGVFLDERGFVAGHMRVARTGRLEEVAPIIGSRTGVAGTC
mmetsp:Transcript_28035/g.83766  ORF Transcript_28035/g.83766 Transcript_28035/m.83766 type:complete len:129 (-) Transcript_28035:69-455(-)